MDALKELDLRVIAHYPILNKVTGRVTAANVLSQCLFWRGKKNGEEFYKTDKEFCQELEMGIGEFKAAKKLLIEGELITVTKRGIPSTSYYRVNMDTLLSRINTYLNYDSIAAQSAVEPAPTNSDTTTEISNRLQTENNVADQEKQLPEFLGKTPLARLVSVYELRFTEEYGFPPAPAQWAMLGRIYKQIFNYYSEWQIAALVLMQFDWYGTSGTDEFSHNQVAARCFPLEWVPRSANAYRAYLQNTIGLDFEDQNAVRKHVTSIIKPLYIAQHGTTAS